MASNLLPLNGKAASGLQAVSVPGRSRCEAPTRGAGVSSAKVSAIAHHFTHPCDDPHTMMTASCPLAPGRRASGHLLPGNQMLKKAKQASEAHLISAKQSVVSCPKHCPLIIAVMLLSTCMRRRD